MSTSQQAQRALLLTCTICDGKGWIRKPGDPWPHFCECTQAEQQKKQDTQRAARMRKRAALLRAEE